MEEKDIPFGDSSIWEENLNGDQYLPGGKKTMDKKNHRMSEEERKKTMKNIMKNIILISVAFLMNFNAYQGLARLQSTLNLDEGIGVISSAVLYGALILSCMFLPKIIINAVGHKWTIPLMFLGYLSWMAANGYPEWWTLVPTSVLVGLCAAPLWTAQCSYFTLVAGKYARLAGELEDAVISRFFGIFFFFFQLSAITGSIISSTVLKPSPAENETFAPIGDDVLQFCGAKDCPGRAENNTNLAPIDSATRWTMVGIFMSIAVGAVVLVIFAVDELPDDLKEEKVDTKKEIGNLLLTTFRLLKNPYMLIVIPLTLYSGFEQASFNAEFSKSFVSCSLGIWKIGLVTLPFGVVNACVSFTSGYIVKFVGRVPVFIAGMCMDLCIQITLMTWMPVPEEEYVLYILSGMWGFTDGIWQTQINGFYGWIFKEESEAAFSNYRMWESVGFIIAFAYSNYICTDIKLYILTSVLVCGMAGYFYIEYDQYKKKQSGDDGPALVENGASPTADLSTMPVCNNGNMGAGITGAQNGGYEQVVESTEL